MTVDSPKPQIGEIIHRHFLLPLFWVFNMLARIVAIVIALLLPVVC
jgi:hypothetical protein